MIIIMIVLLLLLLLILMIIITHLRSADGADLDAQRAAAAEGLGGAAGGAEVAHRREA